ncbi:Low temperature requirement A [Madurella fahalii]|uniref:Low temperature requirement A n=1 Tax=Madurella fahalii TaxID=1157608 RepID=A0ABQ0GGI4_9PEZI
MPRSKPEAEEPLTLFGKERVNNNAGTAAVDKNAVNGNSGDKNAGVAANVAAADQELDAPRRENSEPHNLMLLYDLFFAANMTAFSNIHDTTSVERLVAYVGYFAILWFLWLNVMLFDVRFVVDSISERILRAIHLGAMVGVSVVAPQYDPGQQVKGTFQAFSIILMVSRLTLAAQYGLAIYLRKGDFKPHVGIFSKEASKTGLIAMCACHVVAALIYLGITFRFTDSTNSRVFVAWYIVGVFETCIIFAVSYRFEDLGFKDKTLQDRMKTATLLILGEGVIVVAEHVSTIVKNVNSWTSQTVGVLTATVALIYVLFQIYFDWSWPADKIRKVLSTETVKQDQGQDRGSKISTYFWSLAHFPFHLALVLIMEGATQFVIWWKIVELIDYVSNEFFFAFQMTEAEGGPGIASRMVRHLNDTINVIWEQYPRDLLVSHFHREELLGKIGDFSDEYLTGFPTPEAMAATQTHGEFVEAFRALKVTTLNSILRNFNIEAIEDAGWSHHPETYEQHAFDDAAARFNLVYIYVFCLAGAALILMACLHILSRTHSSTPTQKAVIGVNIVFGVGLMLLASMSRYEAHTTFSTTPWIIPSICLIFLFSLIIIHSERWVGVWRGGMIEPDSEAK